MTAPAFLDPRIRMRDALRELVDESPTSWDAPSLFILRNRLLDRTGSDARPLAELLIEALQRGWRERLTAVRDASQAQFDALVAPFVMQWSAQRFVQPDMARWAVESWAYALRIIDASAIRIAPPPAPAPVRPRESVADLAARLNATVAASNGALGATGTTRSPAWRAPSATRTAASTAPRPTKTGPRSPQRSTAPYTPRARASSRTVAPWIPRALFGTIVFMLVALVVRVAWSARSSRTEVARVVAAATVSPTTAAVTAPSSAPTSVATPSLTTNPDVVPLDTSVTAPVAAAPGERQPGVPAITGGMLSTGADSTRMLFVQPARRATGESRRIATVATAAPVAFDEMRLSNGTTLRGRVEVVRAGTVIFRDYTSGLRVEYRKDDIREIITEFGTTVRFAGNAPTVSATALRTTGVAGRYVVRYAAATAVGSRECTQVWNRAPNAQDVAVVRHIPGADTLSVAFDGGDVFPSNIDADGYFASTFRIVPDQARTMTALTTRLNGKFARDGTLALTVNIVFYRRLRNGEVTCNVTVNAEGRRI